MTGSGTRDSETAHDDHAWLRRLTRGLADGAHDADVLYQDTLVAAWRGAPPQAGTLRPWLSGIARRVVARSHRDTDRRRRRELAAARPEALPATLDVVELAELRRTIDDAVRALTEPYRAIVRMRFWEGLKPGEIAARTGDPVETVRTRIKRAVAMLRARLDRTCGSRAAWLVPLSRWADVARPLPTPRPAGNASASWVAGVAIVGAVAVAVASGGSTSTPVAATPAAVAPGTTTAADLRTTAAATRTEVAPVAATGTEGVSGEARLAVGAAPSVALSRAQDLVVLDVMERIVAAQNAFRSAAVVDVDRDARGEFGYLGELAGLVEPRGRGDGRWWRSPPSGSIQGVERIERGVGSAWGYCFRVYLPGQNGTPIEEADDGAAGPVPLDTDRTEELWCCYAWPCSDGLEDDGSTTVFFVDQTGCVLVADNADRRYAGRSRAPFAAAAFRFDTAGLLGLPAAGTDPHGRGRDGQVWRRAAHPAPIDSIVEVVDPAGAPLADVQVFVVPAPLLLPGMRDDVTAQSRALAGIELPMDPSGTTSGRTDERGRATLTGRATAGATLMLEGPARRHLVPTRVTATGGALRVELPPAPLSAGADAHANESAAIATLKNISSAQAQCQASAVIDVDGDGRGEYGYFGELSGACFLRGSQGPSDQRMSPPVLSSAFGRFQVERSPDAGIVARSGYCFRMFLPDGGGRGLAEAGEGGAGLVLPDADLTERAWCCYAWPFEHGVSGARAFFVDQSGDVYACDNDLMRYSGFDRVPQFTAARAATSGGSMVDDDAANAIGLDGQSWIVVN